MLVSNFYYYYYTQKSPQPYTDRQDRHLVSSAVRWTPPGSCPSNARLPGKMADNSVLKPDWRINRIFFAISAWPQKFSADIGSAEIAQKRWTTIKWIRLHRHLGDVTLWNVVVFWYLLLNERLTTGVHTSRRPTKKTLQLLHICGEIHENWRKLAKADSRLSINSHQTPVANSCCGAVWRVRLNKIYF